MPDPRVFFAAERTLLAWIRTGLTIIAMGFVVARFGLFLRLFAQSTSGAAVHHEPSVLSAVLGVVLVAIGVLAVLAAAAQFQRYIRTLPQEDLPQPYWSSSALVLAYAIAAVGTALAVYLAL